MIDPNQLSMGQPPQNVQMRPMNQGMSPGQFSPPQPDHVQQTGMFASNIRRTNQFYIKHTSNTDGRVYEGQFTSKKLSIKELAQMGVRKAQLNGGYHFDPDKPGNGIDEQTDMLNNMLAHLEVALIQWPMWFNLDEIYDAELLGQVYGKVAEFESQFFRSNRGQSAGPGSGQNDSSGEGQKSRAAGSVEAVGRDQISSTLDP